MSTSAVVKDKWHARFLRLAEHVATWSKDPSTKVGAVIVGDRRKVLGLGYNGFPRGVVDSGERYGDRPTKYQLVVHAEVNAILNAGQSVEGATLYTWPLPPCNECAKVVIQSGIKRIVVGVSHGSASMWDEKHAVAMDMFREAGVQRIVAEVDEV